MRYRLLSFLFFIFSMMVRAQEVPYKKKDNDHLLQEVIISANRSERNIQQMPVPAYIISKRQMKLSGSIKLGDILQEQTGLVLMKKIHGRDLQIQGFQGKHILFLIDDEPIIGRIEGILDLSRFSLSNISQIEIIKGPSSALYGSDALGGVINLITKVPLLGTHGDFYTRYGKNHGFNGGFFLSNRISKAWSSIYLDYTQQKETYLNKLEKGEKKEHLNDLSIGGIFHYDITKEIDFRASLRGHAQDKIDEQFSLKSLVNEYAIGAKLNAQFHPNLKSSIRLYRNVYQGTFLKRKDQGDQLLNTLSYTLNRPEVLFECFFNNKNILNLGMGFNHASVLGRNYFISNKQIFSNHLFFQYEFQPLSKIYLVGGIRFENSKEYGEAFMPKISFRYDISPNLHLKASIGKGFKTPSFEMLYLSLDHSNLGSYYVYGVYELNSKLEEHKRNKRWIRVLDHRNKEIKSEYSWGSNIGFEFAFKKNLRLQLNFFYNEIKNLIETLKVAQIKDSQNKIYDIYSYDNLDEAFTRGIEAELKRHFLDYFYISLGYQYLNSGDRTIIKKIKNKNTLVSIKLEDRLGRIRVAGVKDYPGLSQRSPHHLNAKLFYEDKKKGLFSSIRAVYLSKYYRGSLNAKAKEMQYIKASDYIESYVLLHFLWGKKIFEGLSLQVGVDNLLNYTGQGDIRLSPGRVCWGKLSYVF